jgi:hypothetical protein
LANPYFSSLDYSSLSSDLAVPDVSVKVLNACKDLVEFFNFELLT